MNYIVFDLEFNQFFKFTETDVINPALKNEIIQIGAVKLDENLRVLSTFEVLIRPAIYKKINPYVQKVTKINTNELIKGLTFKEGYNRFREWMGRDYILCTWALDDISVLMENCSFFNCEKPVLTKIINVQDLYKRVNKLDSQTSLSQTISQMEIKKELPFHNAVNDALYTARIMERVYDQATINIIDYDKLLEEKAQNIIELNKKIKRIVLKCPRCGRFSKNVGTHPRNRNKYWLKTKCDNCQLNLKFYIKTNPYEEEYFYTLKKVICSSF